MSSQRNILTVSSNTQPGFTKELELKKSIVTDLANALDIIEKEDSLQMIASLPEKQQEVYIKELLKKLKKEEGLKVDMNNAGLTVKKKQFTGGSGSRSFSDTK